MRLHSAVKYSLSVCLLMTLFFLACKKKDVEALAPEPPVSIADSVFQITSIGKMDINVFDVTCQVSPPPKDSFSRVQLEWSDTSSFTVADSLLLANNLTGRVTEKRTLQKLKQATLYYIRLSLVYRNKKFYSVVKEFKTDTLKIVDYLEVLSRGVWAYIRTNFKSVPEFSDPGTKLWLNDISCKIISTDGLQVNFEPPVTLQAKKYALRFERYGLSVQAPDSVEVLKGKWGELTPPSLTPHPVYGPSALGNYGSCYSDTKGYVIPGLYFRDIPWGDPNFGRPSYLLEFDGLTKTWSQKAFTNPMWFERPVCQYYNNTIYVLGGFTTDIYNGSYEKISKMLKLDLNTLTWQTMGALPFNSWYSISFKMNNEFFVGLGADGNLPYQGARPKPYKGLWKYNPQTNVWKRLADFPGTHEYHQPYPTAFTIGTKAYVYFGAIMADENPQTVNFYQELWEYDTVTDSWRQLTLPAVGGPPKGEKYQIVSYNGKAYFLTAQRRVFGGISYYYELQQPCLEYDPVNGTFKKISITNSLDVMQLVYNNDNKFYFQTDAFGYTDYINNKTFSLEVE